MFRNKFISAAKQSESFRPVVNRRRKPLVESLEDRALMTLAVQFDYSLDSDHFFAQSSRRTLLESTVNAIVARLGDALGALPSNSYTVVGAAGNVTVTTAVPANTLKLYLLGKSFSGTTAGLGGSSFVTQNGKYRGQASSADYAPAISSIRFDDDGSTNWYFGATTSSGVDFAGASTLAGLR